MRAPGSYIGLTVKQAELLSFIRFRQAEGNTPSYEEMREGCDLSSKSAVSRLIDALEERGYACRMDNRARAVEVFAERQVPKSNLRSIGVMELIDELTRRGVKVALG